jgi:hypothetical protein
MLYIISSPLAHFSHHLSARGNPSLRFEPLFIQGGMFSMTTNPLPKYEAVSHLLIHLPTGHMNVDGRQ